LAPWAQGKGLGGTLLAYLEVVVFARAKNLFACVSDFNQGARRFYERHGYRELGPVPNLLLPGSAEILLRKSTGPARGTRMGDGSWPMVHDEHASEPGNFAWST